MGVGVYPVRPWLLLLQEALADSVVFGTQDQRFPPHVQGDPSLQGPQHTALCSLLPRVTESIGLAGLLQAPYGSNHTGPRDQSHVTYLRKSLKPQLGRVSCMAGGWQQLTGDRVGAAAE